MFETYMRREVGGGLNELRGMLHRAEIYELSLKNGEWRIIENDFFGELYSEWLSVRRC